MGRPKRDNPPTREITRMAKCLGPQAKNEWIDARDGYKSKGLTPKDAAARAYVELQIQERYDDWRQRTTMQQVLGKQVALTPKELKEAIPSYTPLGSTKAEEVGDEEMSLAEQVAWAMKWAARVQNGEKAPTRFPCDGALFWFQSAVGNRREFERLIVRVQGPSEGADLYLQDGQYQMKEIEGQIREAVRESGERLVELEAGFGELLKETAA